MRSPGSPTPKAPEARPACTHKPASDMAWPKTCGFLLTNEYWDVGDVESSDKHEREHQHGCRGPGWSGGMSGVTVVHGSQPLPPQLAVCDVLMCRLNGNMERIANTSLAACE